MNRAAKIVQMHEEYKFKNTPVTLAFEAEIKRISQERGESLARIVATLSKMSGVSVRHIYNYREGKTEIQPEQIKVFCEQFNSVALGCAWLSTFAVEQPEAELYDLSRFASRTVRNVLQAGDQFLEAFDDGEIDGHELNELELASAKIQRDARRLTEVARDAHNRRRAA